MVVTLAPPTLMVTVDPLAELEAPAGVKDPVAVIVMVEEKREPEATSGIFTKVAPTLEFAACGSFTVMVGRPCEADMPSAIILWLLVGSGAIVGIWIADGSLIVIVDAIEGRDELAATIPWPTGVVPAGSGIVVTCGSLMVIVDTAWGGGALAAIMPRPATVWEAAATVTRVGGIVPNIDTAAAAAAAVGGVFATADSDL